MSNNFNVDISNLTTSVFSMGSLEELDLSNAYAVKLPKNIFQNSPGLKRLYLQSRLTHLDLSNCRITTVSEETFSRGLRVRLRHLDLSGNYFRCDCDLLWFRAWLGRDADVFSGSWAHYQCRNFRSTDVAKFQMNEQVCLLSREAIVITMVVMVLLMMKLTLTAVVFRYRWHIRLLLYEVFRGTGHNPRQGYHFRYDLFVSYAEEDVSWLRRHLIPELEGRQGVKLCVHQRDFTPGQNIVDNIYQSVQDSRKVLMVFSKHFARSQWCQFELALCLSHVIDNGDALLVACVDDVTSSTELTPTMMAVLNTTTYIQWAEEEDVKASFWARMRIVLNDAVP
ncbi:toll-like receptor 2 type-2 [Littorina saxatilis]|uniref:toll-like receptor 2 type-2 n=1 Tax=Littorina saxatilis TaxID=31220 RepID=UPI0038B5500F